MRKAELQIAAIEEWFKKNKVLTKGNFIFIQRVIWDTINRGKKE
jgi:hypothetical protein